MGRLIDTSVLIALERRDDGSNTDSLLATLPDDALISSIQVGELKAGELAANTSSRAHVVDSLTGCASGLSSFPSANPRLSYGQISS